MSRAVWPASRTLGVCRLLLRAAARRLPWMRRTEWLAELEGELWTLHARGASRRRLFAFSLSAFGAARWERRGSEGWMGGVVRDVGYAARRLRASPGFTAIVVLVVGLGVGANTALLGPLRAALLDAPPYPHADRLVMLDLLLAQRADLPPDTLPWSWPKFALVRERLQSMEDIAGWVPQTATITGAGSALRAGVEYVTPSYFALLGVRPVAGRLFLASDDVPSAAPYIVLSQEFWRARFGADPAVIGRTLAVEGATLEIVGVVEGGFRGLSGSADVWVPVAGITTIRGPRRLQMAWAHWLRAIGRLAAGTTIEHARVEGEVLGRALTEAYPDPSGSGPHGVTMVPFLAARINPVSRLAVSAVSLGAILLLLVACGNVAGLMLARGAARRTDVAIRSALGAARRRMVRESLLESLMLATLGGALGLGIALAARQIVPLAASRALQTGGTRGLEFLSRDALAIDGSVLAMGLALTLAAALLFGVFPAWSGTRTDLNRDLRSTSGGLGGARRTSTARSTLVAAQLALTLVLLAAAGLMAASFARLSAIDMGFTAENVLTIGWNRPDAGPDDARSFETMLLGRVAALPGVQGVAIAPCAPLAGHCEVVGLRRVDDQPPIDYGDMTTSLLAYEVSDAYFETLGIPLKEGRTFNGTDGPGDAPVAIVNALAARTLFPGGSALGHRIGVTHSLTQDGTATIVGVVADVPYASLEAGTLPTVYFSRRQAPASYGTLFVNAAGDAASIAGAVRGVAASLAPDMPLYDVTTMAERRALATARTRVVLGLLASFAAVGLLLSALGLFGVVSFSVAMRTRELGLRFALGASAPDVLRLVLLPGLRLVMTGILVGLAGALVLTRYVEALLFGVRPTDPGALAGATAVLIGVAALAAWLPSRRAQRTSPAIALRSE